MLPGFEGWYGKFPLTAKLSTKGAPFTLPLFFIRDPSLGWFSMSAEREGQDRKLRERKNNVFLILLKIFSKNLHCRKTSGNDGSSGFNHGPEENEANSLWYQWVKAFIADSITYCLHPDLGWNRLMYLSQKYGPQLNCLPVATWIKIAILTSEAATALEKVSEVDPATQIRWKEILTILLVGKWWWSWTF